MRHRAAREEARREYERMNDLPAILGEIEKNERHVRDVENDIKATVASLEMPPPEQPTSTMLNTGEAIAVALGMAVGDRNATTNVSDIASRRGAIEFANAVRGYTARQQSGERKLDLMQRDLEHYRGLAEARRGEAQGLRQAIGEIGLNQTESELGQEERHELMDLQAMMERAGEARREAAQLRLMARQSELEQEAKRVAQGDADRELKIKTILEGLASLELEEPGVDESGAPMVPQAIQEGMQALAELGFVMPKAMGELFVQAATVNAENRRWKQNMEKLQFQLSAQSQGFIPNSTGKGPGGGLQPLPGFRGDGSYAPLAVAPPLYDVSSVTWDSPPPPSGVDTEFKQLLLRQNEVDSLQQELRGLQAKQNERPSKKTEGEIAKLKTDLSKAEADLGTYRQLVANGSSENFRRWRDRLRQIALADIKRMGDEMQSLGIRPDGIKAAQDEIRKRFRMVAGEQL